MNGPNNKIGWCDYTWNPLTGCLHGCTFGPNKTPCYAEIIAERFRGTRGFPNGFDPTFHEKRLDEPLKVKEPARIFVCSMADLWGKWVYQGHQDAVLRAMCVAHWHTFLSLTKAPWNVPGDLPRNLWQGATVTGQLDDENRRLDCVAKFESPVRFLSLEPLCGPVDVARAKPDWVIIGAATGKGGFQPEEKWVVEIEKWCSRNGVPVFHKSNLKIRKQKRREFPCGVVE